MTDLEIYYNKFNEDKRLNSRHGQVEYITSMKYIHIYLDEIARISMKLNSDIRILDVGAATGRYSIPLAEEGYDVTAIEPVQHNLGRLKQKSALVKAYKGNALNLSRFDDGSFDLTLLFGPMYHLHDTSDKLTALREARRVTADSGIIIAAYIMNEFAVLTYAFKEKHITEALSSGMLDDSFHCRKNSNPLYSFVRIEDIDALNDAAALSRIKLVAADGAANYMRPVLNSLSEEEFRHFTEYHLATCERMDLMGASGHTIDILKK